MRDVKADMSTGGVDRKSSHAVGNSYIKRSNGKILIFVGLDSCANIHSVPDIALLDFTEERESNVNTSSGTARASLWGSWRFETTTMKNSNMMIQVKRAVLLPDSGLPLLSVSMLEKAGTKTNIASRYVTFPGGTVYVDCVNGLYGIWGSLDPEIEMVQFKTERCTTFKMEKGDFETLGHGFKIEPRYFEKYNELKGSFTHHAFTTRENASTPSMFRGDWRAASFCGYASLFTPMMEDNEFLVELLTKMDNDFDKAPNDTKYLIVLKRQPQASWWKYICNYELVEKIDKGTAFYASPVHSDVRSDDATAPERNKRARDTSNETDFDLVVLYRDIMTQTRINPLMRLHLRLMHFSNRYLLDLHKKGVDLGVDLNDDMFQMDEKYFCKGCRVRKKLQHVPETHQDFSNYDVFEYVCMDGSGPLPVESLHGNYYVWAIMCLRSRWTELYYSKEKDQATIFVIFKQYLNKIKIRRGVIHSFGVTRRLLTDLGGEFTNKSMENLCEKEGIVHTFAATRMHHQNAHVERYFETLWSGMNRMIFTGDIPLFLWEEVCTHCNFLRNRIGYKTLDNMDDPYKIVHGKHTNELARCRILYSQCWVVTDSFQTKFAADADELRWMGLDENVRGSIVYRPRDKKVFTAGMLSVYENPDEYGKLLANRNFTAFDIQDSREYKYYLERPYISEEPVIKQFEEITNHKAFFSEDDEQAFALVEIRTKTQSKPFWTYLSTLISSDGSYFQACWDYCMINCLGTDFPLFSCINVEIGNRKTAPGIICSYHKLNKNRLQIGKEDGSCAFYPTRKVHEFRDKSILSMSILSTTQIDKKYLNYVDPKDRNDAMKRHDWPLWREAELEELKRFKEMNWLVDFSQERPKGVYVHSTKFVYKLKVLTDGSLDKYKARFVFRGFSMIKFRDFYETYAPVTQIVSMKLFFYFVLHYQLEHYVVDVKSAYENASIDTELWCELPEGFEIDGCKYARVNKAIPGVKQGAYLWYDMLSKQLRKNGFRQSKVEPCLFLLFKEKITCILLIHTDNIMVGCNNRLWFDTLREKVWSKEFTTEHASRQSILGLNVTRVDRYTFSFSQKFYIEKMIEEYKLENDKSVSLPIRVGIENEFDPEKLSRKIDEGIPYRSLVMKCMWVARSSRPETLYACNFFARFSHCYTKELFEELKKVVLYLKGTIDFELLFRVDPREKLSLKFACDASFATYSDRKSVVGVLGWLNDCIIYASSSTCVSTLTSSCESESHAIFEASKVATYCYNWICELTAVQLPVFIFNDNAAAILIMSTRSNCGRSKHFDVKLRYVVELVEKGMIQIAYLPTGKNPSDIFTHSLTRRKFEQQLILMYGEGNCDCLLSESSSSGGDSGRTVALQILNGDELRQVIMMIRSSGE